MRMHFNQADHDRVTAAVAEAEKETSGEIVTIVAHRSDPYHDAGLHWAIGVVFLALSAAAAFPHYFRALCAWLLQSWEHEIEDWKLLTLLLGLLILKFLIVRYALAWMPLRMALTPKGTKARRVRRRAITLFRAVAQGRTRALTGVLIYLSLDEHRAEIVADAAINEKVTPEVWGEAMAALIDGVREGRAADGMAEAVRQVGAVLAQHFPATGDNPNELPDRLIEL
ncbi:TPM domain-containing protein [Sphingobium bisphenolivorans]|uniref:TPM domain-containing protein n=1 Tax=Sphingobium bisphenolivorans TaxID=1335760 RepID=UPI0003A5C0F1|nr:TPM domain-containing protein [Sphingobium bisphenolivorans]